MNKLAIMNVYSRQPECKCTFAMLIITPEIMALLRDRARQLKGLKAVDSEVAELLWKESKVIFSTLPLAFLPEEPRAALQERESVIIDELKDCNLPGKALDWCYMTADADSVYWRSLSDNVEMWTGFLFYKELQEL